MYLVIKNMVCNRCIKVVKETLEQLGLNVEHIELGNVTVSGRSVPAEEIGNALEKEGFELLEDKKAKVVNKIKSTIIGIVYSDAIENLDLKISEYLTRQTGMDYLYLSTLFSSIENITIEQFFILTRIERAKELLKYHDLTLSEISYRLGYSSVQHLSSQFKKVTGLTASQFKELAQNTRKPLDKLI